MHHFNRNFNIIIFIVEKTKISKDTEKLSNTLQIWSNRPVPNIIDITFFLDAHKALTKIDHILSHKESINIKKLVHTQCLICQKYS
jgi:hypothetical protein